MSELKVNKITPATGTAFTFGDSGDTFSIPSGATFANNGTATGFSSGTTIKRHYFSNATRVAATASANTDNFTITSSFVPVSPTAGNNDLWVEWWVTHKGQGNDHGCYGLRFDNGSTTYDYNNQHLTSRVGSGKSGITGGHYNIAAGTLAAGTYSVKVRCYSASGGPSYFNLSTSDDARIISQQQTTLIITEYKNT